MGAYSRGGLIEGRGLKSRAFGISIVVHLRVLNCQFCLQVTSMAREHGSMKKKLEKMISGVQNSELEAKASR